MKIGSLNLRIARPDNLDEQLLESTGCSAAETRVHLQSHCLPGSLAAALLPFIDGDKPVRHTLAEAIAAEGAERVRQQVLKLYERTPGGAGPTTANGGAGGKAKG